MNARNLFTAEEREQIVSAVQKAEKNTSGEIRVHIENSFKGDVLDQAAYIFGKLEMHKTDLRNGVLFYLAVKNRQFAILGDAGINAVVPENFWDNIKEIMANHFKNGELSQGLVVGIDMAGEQLKTHFPYQKDDVNELPDDISFGQ